jgi:hypothetical protein
VAVPFFGGAYPYPMTVTAITAAVATKQPGGIDQPSFLRTRAGLFDPNVNHYGDLDATPTTWKSATR